MNTNVYHPGQTEYFELNFLHAVHRGVATTSFLEVARSKRAGAERCFSLVGRTTLDLEVASQDQRDRHVRCFKRLAEEINSPKAIYRDAFG